MPWCPKCRNEYRPGFTVCADCGSELVDELDDSSKDIAYFGTKQEVESIIGFLADNGFEGLECRYNEEDGQFELLVDNKDDDDFKRAMSVYFKKILPELKRKIQEQNIYFISEQNVKQEETPVPLMEMNDIYEKPDERANEYKSGAGALLVIGVAGAIALVLADLGIIKFPMFGSGKVLINVVMGGMFLAFIVLGISSARTYRKLLKEGESDSKLEAEIIEWLHSNLTSDKIKAFDIPGEQEEVLFFNRIKIIKEGICNNFPDADMPFVDYVAEKVYSEYFE